MTFEEEITYRENILAHIRKGGKIKPEDRFWLLTHKIYNRKMGYPFLNRDIIQLTPRLKYDIHIEIETNNYPGRILPVISAPGGKGEITPSTLCESGLENTSTKTVEMLGLILNSEHPNTTVQYHSDIGLLGISFECEYCDDKQNITVRADSSIGDPRYAMICEKLQDNKVRYQCKMPNVDNFDSFVFTLEWMATRQGTVCVNPNEKFR